MRIASAAIIARGTSLELIQVAEWRARFEVWRGLSKGQEPSEVRRGVVSRFRHELGEESFGEYTDERLMAAIQREVEVALVENPTD